MFLLVIWVWFLSNRLLALLVKAHIKHDASVSQYCKVASITPEDLLSVSGSLLFLLFL